MKSAQVMPTIYVNLFSGDIKFDYELDKMAKNKRLVQKAAQYYEVFEGFKLSRRSRRQMARKIQKYKYGKALRF